MNKEQLAVIIFEECADKTRTSKECAEAIKVKAGITSDIEDIVRRYKQSGKGLEETALAVLSAGGSSCNSTCTSCKCDSDYDTCLKYDTSKVWVDPNANQMKYNDRDLALYLIEKHICTDVYEGCLRSTAFGFEYEDPEYYLTVSIMEMDEVVSWVCDAIAQDIMHELEYYALHGISPVKDMSLCDLMSYISCEEWEKQETEAGDYVFILEY